MDCAFGVIPAVFNFILILFRLWAVFGCGFQAVPVQGAGSCFAPLPALSVPLQFPLGHVVTS